MRQIYFYLVLVAAFSIIFFGYRNGIIHEIKPFYTDKPHISIRFLRQYYSQQGEDRISHLNTITSTSNHATLYNVLVPEVYCPNLVRVGSVNDGGKWICNPNSMPQHNCSIYSLGLRNEISFDRAIQMFNNNSCKLYGYDMDTQNDNIIAEYKSINGVSMRAKIAAETKEELKQYSLGDLFEQNNDTHAEFLKMDIEGSEYRVLPHFLSHYTVCQLFLEMHGNSLQMLQLLKVVSTHGYHMFSYEVNGDSIKACEYSFLHSDCLDRYGAIWLYRYLDRVVLSGDQAFS